MMKHDLWLAELQFCNWLLNSNWLQSFMLHPPDGAIKSDMTASKLIGLLCYIENVLFVLTILDKIMKIFISADYYFNAFLTYFPSSHTGWCWHAYPPLPRIRHRFHCLLAQGVFVCDHLPVPPGRLPQPLRTRRVPPRAEQAGCGWYAVLPRCLRRSRAIMRRWWLVDVHGRPHTFPRWSNLLRARTRGLRVRLWITAVQSRHFHSLRGYILLSLQLSLRGV